MLENCNVVLFSEVGYICVIILELISGVVYVEGLWNWFVDDVMINLMFMLWLLKYVDMVDLNILEIGVNFDFIRFNVVLVIVCLINLVEGVILFLDFKKVYGL